MSNRKMLKSTGVIGFATVLSRILGFIRDIVFAGLFGTSIIAQAFVVAFRIPNTLRDLVGEGAMNSAIVPVLSEYKALGDEKEFRRAAKVLFNIALASLSVLTVLGVVFSPFIVRLMAPGFVADPEKLMMTVMLNRAIFPYLVMIGLTAYSMGVLNSMRHFAAPAFGPCLMNIIMITTMVWLYPNIGVMALAWGVLAGGAVQLALNIPFMYRQGVTIDPKAGFRHPAIRRIGKLLAPRAFGSAVYQINIFVDTILASLSAIVGSGGVAALYFANRLIQFPLAIFGVALAQAALPKMSLEFASNDLDRMKTTISFSLRAVFSVMVPASFALAVLGEPVIRLLFQRGEFTAESTLITSSALFYYSFGLIAYGGIKLLVTAFYSMHDTRTPVKTAFFAVIVNILLNLTLMWPMKLGGLALATSISAVVNFLLLYIALQKKIGDFGTKIIAGSFLKVFSASVLMSVAIKGYQSVCCFSGVSWLCAVIGVGGVSFLIAGYIIGVKEVRDLVLWISGRR